MVGGVHYRPPGLWIKATTTLDMLSGGRAWFGIGAAWNVHESKGLGFAFPPLEASASSGSRTRCRWRTRMWSGGSGTGEAFEGTHVDRDAPHQLAPGDQPAADPDPRRWRR